MAQQFAPIRLALPTDDGNLIEGVVRAVSVLSKPNERSHEGRLRYRLSIEVPKCRKNGRHLDTCKQHWHRPKYRTRIALLPDPGTRNTFFVEARKT